MADKKEVHHNVDTRRRSIENMDPAARSKRIIFLLCPSFHGATLVSLVLGSHRGAFSLGDTVPRVDVNTMCSCGKSVKSCDFWSLVAQRAGHDDGLTLVPIRPHLFGAEGALRPAATAGGPMMLAPRMRLLLDRYAVVALSILRVKWGYGPRWHGFAASHAALVGLCAEQNDFSVFVDGAKSCLRYLALKASGAPIGGVIHLLRDPRAFAASMKRSGFPVGQSAHTWCGYHRNVARLTRWANERVLRMRYKDICTDPVAAFGKMTEFAGLAPAPLPKAITLTHWLGNSTMRRFDGKISDAQRWEQELSADEVHAVEQITRRVACSFGYDFSSPGPSRSD